MLTWIIIMFAAIGIGFPIAWKMDLSPLMSGLLCGGLNALLSLIFLR